MFMAELLAGGKVFANDTPPSSATICGLLTFDRLEGDVAYYNEISDGNVMVYLTDCQGNIEAGEMHPCAAGNILRVEGCHAFGCNCAPS